MSIAGLAYDPARDADLLRWATSATCLAVLFGGLRGWTPQVFRASLQGFFIVTSVVIADSHGAARLWTREVLVLYLFALPLSLIAIRLGNIVATHAPAARLERLINGAIVLLGVGLLVT